MKSNSDFVYIHESDGGGHTIHRSMLEDEKTKNRNIETAQREARQLEELQKLTEQAMKNRHIHNVIIQVDKQINHLRNVLNESGDIPEIKSQIRKLQALKRKLEKGDYGDGQY